MSDQATPTDAAPEDDGLDDIRDFFAAEQLRIPPIPRDMLPTLIQHAAGEWGTDAASEGAEPARRDLTDPSDFLTRATDPAHPDEIGFGHVGHGISSWWIAYQLITPALGLFFRQGYGGPYGDAEAARTAINEAFYDAEELLIVADEARDSGTIPQGQRLLVVLDGPDRSFWGLSADFDRWHTTPDPIGAALDFLHSD